MTGDKGMTGGGFAVVHLIDTLSPGGAQRLLSVLAAGTGQACRAVLDLRGHDRGSAMERDLLAAGVTIRRAGIRRARHPGDWLRLWRCLRAMPSPVVHLHLTDSVIMGAPLARLMGRRVVVTVHNTRTVSSGRPGARVKQALETLVLRHLADHVILVGAAVAQAQRARLAGLAQTVLPNVIQPPAPPPPGARHALRAAAGLGPESVVFIATGRLHPQKDPATLLVAFARLRADRPGAVLWLLGDGALRGALETQAAALGLTGAVRFFGAQRDVAAHLAAADVFVLSSAWEGLPLGLLEAMAAGLPVVATAVGEVPALLGQGGGLLVPPGDAAALAAAMAALAGDGARRAAAGAQARVAVAPHLDAAAWRAAVQAVYDRLPGSTATAAGPPGDRPAGGTVRRKGGPEGSA